MKEGGTGIWDSSPRGRLWRGWGGEGGAVVATEPAEGAGPAPLGNLRLLGSGSPMEAGKRSGKFGNLRCRGGIVLEDRRYWNSSQRGGGGVFSFKGGATA